MSKFFIFFQIFFVCLILFYAYQINFQAPLLQAANQIYMISIGASFFGFIFITILKKLSKLKDFTKRKSN